MNGTIAHPGTQRMRYHNSIFCDSASLLPLALQVTINLKTLGVGDATGEDCVLGFATRQYQVIKK